MRRIRATGLGSQTASLLRHTRVDLRRTQQSVADAAGIARGYLAAIEQGAANPTVHVVGDIARALGVEVRFDVRAPVVLESPQRDIVHARCIAYVERRLRSGGWLTAHEVEIALGRSHGWIDVLAFDPHSGCLLVVEVKSILDDLGAAERQVGWYSRAAIDPARRLGWRPRRIVAWLLVAATEQAEVTLLANRDLLGTSFPTRAPAMLRWLIEGQHSPMPRGLALIDPRSKRRAWLIRARADGRRSAAPYGTYAEMAARLARRD